MELRYRTAIVLVVVLWATAARVVQGQIFVGSVSGTPQDLSGFVGEYNLDGTAINSHFIGGTPSDIATAGSSLYLMNGGGETASSITRFTTDGRRCQWEALLACDAD